MSQFRQSTPDKPGQCQHCGCEPDAIPLCEHLIPPMETLQPKENKILFCPACPDRKYKWYQFMKKYYQRKSAHTPMLNLSENNYQCQFCSYGYRA